MELVILETFDSVLEAVSSGLPAPKSQMLTCSYSALTESSTLQLCTVEEAKKVDSQGIPIMAIIPMSMLTFNLCLSKQIHQCSGRSSGKSSSNHPSTMTWNSWIGF
jgi:hypothetical protein